MAEVSGIPTSSMGKISRWWSARKAAGQMVNPWEMESMMEAEMNSAASQRNANKGLALQAARDAESVKQNAINNELTREQIDANEKGQMTGALTQAATTGLGLYLMNGGKKKAGEVAASSVAETAGGVTPGSAAASELPGTTPAGTFNTSTSGWNPIKNTGKPTNWTVSEPVNSTGSAVQSGIGEEALGVTAGEGTGGTALAGEEAAGGYASMTGAAPAAAEGAGATVGSVAGGVASAAPYIAAWKVGMPYLKDIMAKGTEDAFGIERDSSNVIAQMNDMAGDARGVVTPALEKMGVDVPEGFTAVTNPGGYLLDKVLGPKGMCIIVTACTYPDSPEVNIAREYRDKFLTAEERRGYYVLAHHIVPAINRFPLLKRFTKWLLVDNLIEYGRYRLHQGDYPSMVSLIVTRLFLDLCLSVGRRRPSFVRQNGEVV